MSIRLIRTLKSNCLLSPALQSSSTANHSQSMHGRVVRATGKCCYQAKRGPSYKKRNHGDFLTSSSPRFRGGPAGLLTANRARTTWTLNDLAKSLFLWQVNLMRAIRTETNSALHVHGYVLNDKYILSWRRSVPWCHFCLDRWMHPEMLVVYFRQKGLMHLITPDPTFAEMHVEMIIVCIRKQLQSCKPVRARTF